MPSTFDNPPLVTGKRKRATIFYAEEDPNVVDEVSGDEQPIDDPVSDTDDDLDFGKKASKKRKPHSRKSKSRLTPPRKARKLPEKHFRFLDLSAELRNIIYELTLTDPNGISLVPQTKAYRRTVRRGAVYNVDSYNYRYYKPRGLKSGSQETAPRATDLIPALLAVSKQVYAEGIDYLYAQPFFFAGTMALYHFLPSIGPLNQQRLRDLTVNSWGTGRGANKAANHCAFALLAGATGLSRLSVEVKLYASSPVLLARAVFRDLHFFLEAYGMANGSRDAGVGVVELKEENFEDLYLGPARRRWYGRDQSVAVPREDAVKGYEAELRKLLKGR